MTNKKPKGQLPAIIHGQKRAFQPLLKGRFMCTTNTESELSYTHRIISQYCDSKRFGTFIKILAIAALAFCLPAVAQEQNAWQFGSLPANSSRLWATAP